MSSPGTPVSARAEHVAFLNHMYALQRHVYDLTRKYYLFGRDRLIHRMPIEPHQHVAEIGCGTGRNLVLLARRHPQASFYGIDAARVMLATAQRKVYRHNLRHHVHLHHGMAEDLSARAWFDLPKFDHIFFSYSLSMIPKWPFALQAALANLGPGGELWAVDFWDQAGYPKPFARFLKQWLALFHVHHRPELLAHFHHLHASGRGILTIEPVGQRYAFLARFVKAA